jgi:hypothetical protein
MDEAMEDVAPLAIMAVDTATVADMGTVGVMDTVKDMHLHTLQVFHMIHPIIMLLHFPHMLPLRLGMLTCMPTQWTCKGYKVANTRGL